MPKLTADERERFDAKWSLEPETGCMLWTASRSPTGFGLFGVGGVCRMAHRVAYQMRNGHVPHNADVLHACRNLHCVNPEHLFLGWQHSGVDKILNGRAYHPAGRPLALTEDQALHVHAMRRSGGSYRTIARLMGVSPKVIENVLTGKTWSHLMGAA